MGEIHVPGLLYDHMRKAARVEIVVPFEERARHTLSTYRELGENTAELTPLLRYEAPSESCILKATELQPPQNLEHLPYAPLTYTPISPSTRVRTYTRRHVRTCTRAHVQTSSPPS